MKHLKLVCNKKQISYSGPETKIIKLESLFIRHPVMISILLIIDDHYDKSLKIVSLLLLLLFSKTKF
jgi:hypothetical protein